jgi:protein arginine N-methyltransferase 5
MAHAIYLSLGTLVIPSPILANRAYLPSYARVISNLLQMGGAAAHTNISIRIPISDPFEIIGQGPANPQINRNSNSQSQSQHHGQPSISGQDSTTAAGAAGKHKRIGSLSTRPTSMHQNLPVTMQNMRVPSGASAASSTMSAQSTIPPSSGGDPSSTWEMWDTIRSLCGYHPRLSISESPLSIWPCGADDLALDLTNPLPPSIGALSRWTAEPVKNVWLPATAFIPNAKGYPVLSKACQAFLRAMTKVRHFQHIV